MGIFNKKLILLFLISALAFLSSCASQYKYTGKVIDAETLKPLEGVAVAGEWNEWGGGGFTYHTRQYYIAETLTDENGEWEITGPEVSRTSEPNNFDRFRTAFFGYIQRPPGFIFFKPMYCKENIFIARPYFYSKKNQDGIIFFKGGVPALKELDALYEKNNLPTYSYDWWPFTPVDNPNQKLKDVQFSYQYQDNQELVYIPVKDNIHKSYRVVGLKKAKTWDEIQGSTFVTAPGGSEKTPIFYKMINDARKQKLLYRRNK